MSCPQHIWLKAQAEGVSLSELGRRGALKRASIARKRKAELEKATGYTQQELFRARNEH
jgi:hypothetical protein